MKGIEGWVHEHRLHHGPDPVHTARALVAHLRATGSYTGLALLLGELLALADELGENERFEGAAHPAPAAMEQHNDRS